MALLSIIVGGFGTGVVLRSLFVFSWPVATFVGLLALLCFFGSFLTPRRALTLAGVFLVCTALGALRFMLADMPLPKSFAHALGTPVAYEGVVVSDPDVRDTHQRVTITVRRGSEEAQILAVAEQYPEVEVGDRVELRGVLEVPEPFADTGEGGRVFAYDRYLQKDGIRFIVQRAVLTRLEEKEWSVLAFLVKAKHIFLNGLGAVLPEPHASLAGGIVIGGKSGLGTDLKEAFIATGLVQIIVLSGYNVMVVAEWVMYLIGLLKARRGLSAAAGALALVLFVAIAGASTTAVRAALMALIALYARATGRTYAAGRALLMVAVLMVLLNPFILAFDPGFALSVAATAGLIWLAPLFDFWLRRISNAFWRDSVATTLAAQTAVLPLLLYETGNLSLIAVPANIVVAPLMPFAMALAALAGIAGIVLGVYGYVLALPAYVVTTYLIFVAEKGSMLPLALFHLPAFPFVVVVAAYAALIYFAFTKRSSMALQLLFSKNAST